MNAASGIVHRIRASGPGSRRAGATLLLLLTWSVGLAMPLAVHGWVAGGHVTLEQQASRLLAVRRTSEHQHGLLPLHAHDAQGGVTIGPAPLAGRDHGASTTLTLWQAVLLAALPLLAVGGWWRSRRAGDRRGWHHSTTALYQRAEEQARDEPGTFRQAEAAATGEADANRAAGGWRTVEEPDTPPHRRRAGAAGSDRRRGVVRRRRPVSDPAFRHPLCRWRADLAGRPRRAARRELLSVSGKGSVTDPAWSPDGTRIAYSFMPAPAAGATYGSDIYIMDADGSSPRAVFTHDADGGLARAPAWTPDGASLYFSYSFSRPVAAGAPLAIVQQIERLDLKTGGRAVVAPDGDLPSLSPDGARLAYVKLGLDLERKSSLWLAAADGSGARPLVPEGQFTALWAPRFARDGATIFFTASGGDRSNPRLKVAPLRSSSQDWPAAVSAHGFPMDIWLVDPASGRLELLAALAADDLTIVPSPDGGRLALSSGAGLFVLDLASGSTTVHSPIPSFGSLDWRAQ